MEFVPVVSSNIQSIAYDENGAVLGVRFHGGGDYRYRGVPLHVFQGFFAAPSKGQYFDRYVRKAGYSYQRVG